ncbi:MAG: hypothetical protein KAT00_09025 [Planctomycetes bacterium]|nr:hypothetical protein [Planctomycetota bacterium]
MRQSDGHNIDELLSGYIDGQLSQRQHTEVKRLLQHDKEIAQELLRLKKQKQLLNSLPVTPAPQGLLDGIKSDLERSFILQEHQPDAGESAGVRHLFYRRALTTAAMLILPLMALGWVVYSIVMPAGVITEAPVAGGAGQSGSVSPDAEVVRLEDVDEGPYAAVHPLSVALQLYTGEPISINGFIQKAIYNNDLIDYTIPDRQPTETIYRISCSADRIALLLVDIEAAWGRCESRSLAVHGHEPGSDVVIEDISAEQAMTIFRQTDPAVRMKIAARFADQNTISPDGTETEMFASETDSGARPVLPPGILMPELTSSQPQKQGYGQDRADENVNLVITVTGL